MSGCSIRKNCPFLYEKRSSNDFSFEKIYLFLIIYFSLSNYHPGTSTVLHSLCAGLRERIAL